jgi:type IV fimbrial biogenesis protein FimT
MIQPSPSLTQRRSGGFTLVELIITVVVLAVFASLAAPSFAQFIDNRRLAGAAESVKTGLNLARGEAMKRSANVSMVVTLDGANWTVGVEAEDDACSDETEACLMLVEGTRFPGVTIDPGTLVDGAAVEDFEPVRGLAGGRVYELTSARNRILEVRLNALGHARVCMPAGQTGSTMGYGICP